MMRLGGDTQKKWRWTPGWVGGCVCVGGGGGGGLKNLIVAEVEERICIARVTSVWAMSFICTQAFYL